VGTAGERHQKKFAKRDRSRFIRITAEVVRRFAALNWIMLLSDALRPVSPTPSRELATPTIPLQLERSPRIASRRLSRMKHGKPQCYCACRSQNRSRPISPP